MDGADLTALLQQWGVCGSCSADITADGFVSGADLTALLVSWGAVCAPWYEVIESAPDPAIVTSATLRNAIIATGYPWRVRDAATQIELLLVPPGTFDMGCSASIVYPCVADWENPVHAVTISTAFYMGRYEVTQAQWQSVMGSNPAAFQPPQFPGSTNRPVERVSWNMIQSFLGATGTRLPTEAEWEYAYRGGTSTAFHSMTGEPNGTADDSLVGLLAWYEGNSDGQTHVVGGKASNALGLHDMSGNVSEWVNDWFGPAYYASSPPIDPPGPSSGAFGARVIRGGSWESNSRALRSSARTNNQPTHVGLAEGFRVAHAAE